MDAKQACDKLNGFNFQNRYLVGTHPYYAFGLTLFAHWILITSFEPVLYHQPEKMAKSKEDLAERQENLEKLKREHGID